jgi:scyllo-inositol 2-dehydrogenase (NADP+)
LKQIQVGIIGYGLSGQVFHGPFLKASTHFNVHLIYARDPSKKTLAKADFPEAEVVSDLNRLFESDTLDLIVVCTPNVQHYELAKRALESGKHVVVEKPFTVTSEEAKSLILLAKEKNLKLSVYHNRRFDGDFKTLKSLIKEEALGRIVSFESHFDRFRPAFKENSWKEEALPGSGILYDLGSHLIDQALCLFGRPEALYATLSSERMGVVDDAFEVIFYYPQLKVTLKASNLIKEPTPRFALYGTKGAFVKYGLDPQEDALRAGKLPLLSDWGKDREGDWGILNTLEERKSIQTQAGSYDDFYQRFYLSLISDAPLPVSADDALTVILLIEAAIKSNQTKCRVSL